MYSVWNDENVIFHPKQPRERKNFLAISISLHPPPVPPWNVVFCIFIYVGFSLCVVWDSIEEKNFSDSIDFSSCGWMGDVGSVFFFLFGRKIVMDFCVGHWMKSAPRCLFFSSLPWRYYVVFFCVAFNGWWGVWGGLWKWRLFDAQDGGLATKLICEGCWYCCGKKFFMHKY